MTINWDEKRKHKRVGISLFVRYKTPNSKTWHETIALNISPGGILLTLKENLKLGTEIEMDIYLPDEKKPIEAVGKVVWNSPLNKNGQESVKFFSGIEFAKFIKIDDDSTTKIMNAVYNFLHKASKN